MSASCLVQALNLRGLARNAIVETFPVWVLTNSQEVDRVNNLIYALGVPNKLVKNQAEAVSEAEVFCFLSHLGKMKRGMFAPAHSRAKKVL